MGKLDYYDDNKYLGSHDLEAINYVYGEKAFYELCTHLDKDKYAESILAYNEYVEYIAYLIKCMSIPNNAISASLILGLLIKIGLFSDGYEFISDKKAKDLVFGSLGINVIKGRGVCRHVASFESDVLKKLGLFSEPFYCYSSPTDIGNARVLSANHAINLIEYNDNLYGYDAFNFGIYKFAEKAKMKELFVTKPHYVYYKPYINLMCNGETVSSVNNLVKLFDNLKGKPIISLNEYKMIIDEAQKVIHGNSLLTDEFHRSSKKYIKRITDNLK